MELRKSFRQLIDEIISFIKEDFHPWAYLYSVLFVSALIVVAYGFDGYHRFIAPLYRNGQSWWAMPLIYSAVYFPLSKEHPPFLEGALVSRYSLYYSYFSFLTNLFVYSVG